LIFESIFLVSVCGFTENATSETKVISSPNWPGPYNNFDNCIWVITTIDQTGIVVFFESFHTEANYDFLVRNNIEVIVWWGSNRFGFQNFYLNI